MKRVLLLLLCLAAFAKGLRCEAAEPCYPPNAVNVELTTFPESKALWLITEGASQHLTYWCDLNYYWHFVAISGYRKNLVGDWMEKLTQFSATETTQAEKAAIVDAIVKGSIESTYPELKPIQDAIRDATRPPPIKWIVKAYASGTRPYYAVVNGVRRTTKAGDIRISSECFCWRLVKVEGDSHMCDVAGNVAEPPTKLIPADHVALCVRQN